MKRLMLATLSIAALSVLVSSPALALSDRFEDAREDTINQLTDRFDDARDTTINRLTDRFEDSYQDNLDS